MRSPCSCRTAPCSSTMSLRCGASNAKSFAGSEAKSKLRLPVRERSSSTLSLSHRPSRNRTNARRSDNAPGLPAALVSHPRVCCLCGSRQRCCELRDLDEMPVQHRLNGRRKIHVIWRTRHCAQGSMRASTRPCCSRAFIPRAPPSSLLALQQIADLREQSLLLGQCGRVRRLGLHHPIHQLDHEEQNPSDDDEVDDDGEETPPRQDRALFLGFDQRIRGHLR